MRVQGAAKAPCAIEGCPRDAARVGFCKRHYERRRVGDPDWARPVTEKRTLGAVKVDRALDVLARYVGSLTPAQRARMADIFGEAGRQRDEPGAVNS